MTQEAKRFALDGDKPLSSARNGVSPMIRQRSVTPPPGVRFGRGLLLVLFALTERHSGTRMHFMRPRSVHGNVR